MATENSGLWLATALAAPLGYAVLALFVVVLPLATALRCVRRRCCNPRRFDWSGAHVLITGGSSGIGLAVAQEVAKRGASVTLVARTRTTLKAALAAVSSEGGGGVHGFEIADVTSFAAVEAACAAAVAARGPITALIACAGSAAPGYFLEQPASTFSRTMELNYMGVVHAVKCVAPSMCERGNGRIVLVASGAAVVSFIGYSSYAPTKWALRGFADALRNEFVGFNGGAKGQGVHVSIAYPPDTQTPGFDRENESKPAETSRVAPPDVYTPRAVAVAIAGGVEAGDYHLPSPDPMQNLLISSMSGVSPRAYPLIELAIAPLVGAIEWGFLLWADYVAAAYGRRCSASAVVGDGAAAEAVPSEEKAHAT